MWGILAFSTDVLSVPKKVMGSYFQIWYFIVRNVHVSFPPRGELPFVLWEYMRIYLGIYTVFSMTYETLSICIKEAFILCFLNISFLICFVKLEMFFWVNKETFRFFILASISQRLFFEQKKTACKNSPNEISHVFKETWGWGGEGWARHCV